MHIDEVVLHFLEGENEGVEIKLTPPRELYIGRSEDSDIFLGEKKISRKHTMIQVDENAIKVTDLESTNGTFVNSKKITSMDLKNGDKIKVGSSVIEVQIQSSIAADAPTGAKSKEKSSPKTPPKKNSEKVKSKAKEVESEEEEKGAETLHVNELEELDVNEPKVEAKGKSKKKNFDEEEDSDLVVEYQTAIKENKKNVEHETSERVDNVESEEEPAGDNEFDLKLDINSDEHKAPEAPIDHNLSLIDDDEASFDRIPEFENMASDAGDDLILDEEKSTPKTARPLMGDLSAMGLSDLLQNLHQNKKTGVLTMSNNSNNGKILISEGVLLGAECGKSYGIKAIYRMLTWKSGDFEFQAKDVGSAELQTDQIQIEDSVETILMEGFRQYDELRKIQKVLPQMEDELALEEHLDIPISKLHPKVLDVVQLIINHKKMKNVLDLSVLSDLETSKIVFYLIKKKVICIKK